MQNRNFRQYLQDFNIVFTDEQYDKLMYLMSLTLKKNEVLIISSSLNKDILVFRIKDKKVIIKDESFTPEGIVFIRTISKTTSPCTYTRLEIKKALTVNVEFNKNNIETYKVLPTSKVTNYKKIEINIDANNYILNDNNELVVK